MADTQKRNISVGDTFKVQFESVSPTDQDTNSYNPTKTPVNPTGATAQVWDVINQVFLEIGGVGVDTDSCDVTDNVIEYTVAASQTTAAGDYKLFITADYADGQKVTAMRTFKVNSKS